jgi:hypothetical protein
VLAAPSNEVVVVVVEVVREASLRPREAEQMLTGRARMRRLLAGRVRAGAVPATHAQSPLMMAVGTRRYVRRVHWCS